MTGGDGRVRVAGGDGRVRVRVTGGRGGRKGDK